MALAVKEKNGHKGHAYPAISHRRKTENRGMEKIIIIQEKTQRARHMQKWKRF